MPSVERRTLASSLKKKKKLKEKRLSALRTLPAPHRVELAARRGKRDDGDDEEEWNGTERNAWAASMFPSDRQLCLPNGRGDEDGQ
uniref:Uncharacterized protein n=1 Tax=Caenorhabditis japonica TaxID=281687 RepID=A0A8R1IAX5_CAEJA